MWGAEKRKGYIRKRMGYMEREEGHKDEREGRIKLDKGSGKTEGSH